MDDHLVHAEGVGPDGLFATRTETLKTYGVQARVDRRMLDQYGDEAACVAQRELWCELEDRIEKAGRLVVGEVVEQWSEDPMRDCVWLRLTTRTRQSDVGQWASIWQAIREDGWA